MTFPVKHPQKQPLDHHLDDDGCPASREQQERRELGIELIEAERKEQERVRRQVP